MKQLNFAMVGTGYIAHMHAKALQKIEGTQIKSVCSRTLAGAKEFATAYQVPGITEDFDQVIADEQIDALIIATPNVWHAPYTIAALTAGKDVFIEKPMAMNSLEASEIAAAADAHEGLVMVGHMWRFDEETRALKQVIDQGTLGDIVKTKGYGIHVDWGPAGWFSKQALAGGGALIDMGVHAIDTVRFLLNDPLPISVYAHLETRYQEDIDVDDTGIMVIRWDNGTTSLIESGWWHPYMDGPEAGTQLFGTKGYGNLFPTRFKMAKDEAWVDVPVPEKTDHCDQSIYDRQMEGFVQDILERSSCHPGLEEGQCVMKIVDAAYRSSKSGEVVHLAR